MAKSGAERDAQYRAAQKKRGLVARKIWVHESRLSDLEEIKARLEKPKRVKSA